MSNTVAFSFPDSMHYRLLLSGQSFESQTKLMQSDQYFFCHSNTTPRAGQEGADKLDFWQFGCIDHRVLFLQIPPPCALVIVGAAVSLCIAMRGTEVVSTSKAQGKRT